MADDWRRGGQSQPDRPVDLSVLVFDHRARRSTDPQNHSADRELGSLHSGDCAGAPIPSRLADSSDHLGDPVLSQPFRLRDDPHLRALWTAQSGKCALCGELMLRNRFEAKHARVWAKRRATLDHIVPLSKGGADHADNWQLTHAHCNKIKGNRI